MTPRSNVCAVIALALASLFASSAAAQVIDPPGSQSISAVSTGGGCATANSCASAAVGNAPAVTFSVTGTLGTLTFEATANGGTWFTLTVVRQSDGTQVSTATSTGLYSASNVGVLSMRVRATTWASETATVTVTRGWGVPVALKGAPLSESFWVGAPSALLTAEHDLSALSTGLVLNTAGTPSAYGGSACTNQFVRSLNGSGSATCAAVALGSDVSGTLPLANGGAAAALTAANGGLVYSTATALAVAAAGSSGQIARSGGAGAPTWSTATFPSTATGTGTILRADGTNWVASTATYPNVATGTGTILRADGTNWVATTATFPATTTVSQLLYSSATNTVGGLATANDGVLITSGTGVPSISSTIPTATQDNITRVGTVTNGTWNATDIAVADGGTGASTLGDAGVLIGNGTGAVQVTSAGTAGQVFTSNGAGVDPTFQAVAGAATTRICSGTSTTTNASAENVATCAISGLTNLDTLTVTVSAISVTQQTAGLFPYNSTDAVSFATTGTIAAGASTLTQWVIRQVPNAATNVFDLQTFNVGGSGGIAGAARAFTTNWTGAWTLALRQTGVTAGGTLHWSWAVYKAAGQ